MLDSELERQERLKSTLKDDPEMREQISEEMLFHHYKLLQFFDTLALYFCMEHPEHRKQTTFHNVPQSVGQDVSITITPKPDGSYELQPFPFSGDSLEVSLPGTKLQPQPVGTDIQKLLRNTPKTEEQITLVPASSPPHVFVGNA